MMAQAQKLQQEMESAQASLKDEEVSATAGGGAVKVTVTGELVVKEIKIDQSVVDPEDVEMLEDLVMAATNEALRAAQDLAASKMGALTQGLGGLGLPGM